MLETGKLYIVATPIGNLGDMTERAISTLKSVQLVAAEDTRVTVNLLRHFDIHTPLLALHAFNESQRCDALLERLEKGDSIALVSDAGTPLISDPGYLLVKQARLKGIQIVPIPGACAVIAALCVSGLACDRFIFEGFLPAKTVARQEKLKTIAFEMRTVIFYEVPHRLLSCVEDMVQVLGQNREVVLAREITKFYETIYGSTTAGLLNYLQNNLAQIKGECVLVIGGAVIENTSQDREVDNVLDILMEELPLKQATKLAAKITGHNKNQLYQKALLKIK